MLLPRLGALLLAARFTIAFKNTSPFVLVSSEPLPKDATLQNAQVALTKDVEDRLIETLSACDKKFYHIFSQDQINADDFRNGAMSKLQNHVASAAKDAVVQIPEVMVMGELSSQSIKRRLEETCSKKGMKSVFHEPTAADEYQIAVTNRPSLPTDSTRKAAALSEADAVLDEIMKQRQASSVLIYITTPPREPSEMEDSFTIEDPYLTDLHTELRRNLHLNSKRQEDNGTWAQKDLGLFEKYQFFTPGLFMGLGVSVFLLFLLYIGISAIAGLEVSYFAFSKEMGREGQKKQQ